MDSTFCSEVELSPNKARGTQTKTNYEKVAKIMEIKLKRFKFYSNGHLEKTGKLLSLNQIERMLKEVILMDTKHFTDQQKEVYWFFTPN